jgi:hypothetical protein
MLQKTTLFNKHGLSATISNKWLDCNVYHMRKPIKPGYNTATEETRDIPGSCRIQGRVANLFGQYAMGKPGRYPNFGIPDSALDREEYFKSALLHLAEQIPCDSSSGLAGGNWERYWTLLTEFSDRCELKIRIYKLDA